MKYVILVYSNPESRAAWAAFSQAEQAEGWRAYAALTDRIAAAGELVVTEALADPALARRVTVRRGRTVTTDGPFAEAKELLAGFYLVECASIERAIEHAAQVPEAEFGLVEVRPVMALPSADG
jgi:hypothetical protein